MTDRELLELAAKAAGIPATWDAEYEQMTLDYSNKAGTNYEEWNPLTDDGDALRLAVKLGLVVDTSDGVHVQYIIDHIGYFIGEYEFIDIYAATRRAIVRAAAEIGKATS